jgi:hypothetical protein
MGSVFIRQRITLGEECHVKKEARFGIAQLQAKNVKDFWSHQKLAGPRKDSFLDP